MLLLSLTGLLLKESIKFLTELRIPNFKGDVNCYFLILLKYFQILLVAVLQRLKIHLL